MKKFVQKKCRKMFLEAIFFRIRENGFQGFGTKFLSLLYMISLAYKIFHCLSPNHNPKLRCVICTGVTLFALVLHLNCTALNRSESSNSFMCIVVSESPETGAEIFKVMSERLMMQGQAHVRAKQVQWLRYALCKLIFATS